MVMPTASIPTFDVEIYSTKQTVKFRPFLVKEEKLLIMAQESGKAEDISKAMQDIVTACSNNVLDGSKLPLYDLQNTFLRLRSQSIGAETEFSLICGNCNHRTPFILNLDKIELKFDENHTNKIQLEENLGVIMKYPTPNVISNEETTIYDLIVACIDQVYTDSEVHNAADETKEEIESWVDDLTNEQFYKIVYFFESMPRLEHEVEYTCSKCNTENLIVMNGLESFFG